MARTRSRVVNGKLVEEQVPDAQPQPAAEAAVDLRANGSIRRPGKGGRTLADFFAEGNRDRPLSRGEYVNLRSSEEYSRRETRWYRRLWRWLRHWPPVVDINGRTADAHARTLDAVRRQLEAQSAAQDRAGQV